MTTPAALRELADRLEAQANEREADFTPVPTMNPPTHFKYTKRTRELLHEAATQLRTAASEGGPSEVVAYQWFRNGEPTGGWFDGVPTERQLQAQKQCTGVAEWTVKYAYSHPPEVARDAGRLDFIASEYLHLIPFEMPTGGGDADVGWVVRQSNMTGDIEIARHYADDPRAAIDAALRARAVG